MRLWNGCDRKASVSGAHTRANQIHGVCLAEIANLFAYPAVDGLSGPHFALDGIEFGFKRAGQIVET